MKLHRHILACALALASSHALAMPPFPKAIPVLRIDDENGYYTDWTAYPIRVEKIDTKTHRPVSMILALFEDGKEGGFEGIVEIDCDQPTGSVLSSGAADGKQITESLSLKDAMENGALPRKVVSNVFSLFCKIAPPSPSELNVIWSDLDISTR